MSRTRRAAGVAMAALLAAGCSRRSRESARADAADSGRAPAPIAADDAHNHDGSHAEASPVDCGIDYMLPGARARLGSHSFMIIARDGADHIIASHRSGTPPHNYQILWRVRLDGEEMAAVERLERTSRTLPAFTTIYFDESGTQLDRTFFCLGDLDAIFGARKRKGDGFERRFPIRASLQKDADHEGTFAIKASVSRGDVLSIEREDVEILVNRYLPAYLPQDALRAAIRARGAEVVPRLSHAPIRADEAEATASKRGSYVAGDGAVAADGASCPRNTYLRDEPVPATIHSFLLVAEAGDHAVIATHYYDQAPQNFQTVVKLTLNDEEMAVYRRAARGTRVPPMFQTRSTFCMQDLRALVQRGELAIEGTVYKDPGLDEYRRGAAVGELTLGAADVEVLVNRRLESLMNVRAVAKAEGAWSARP